MADFFSKLKASFTKGKKQRIYCNVSGMGADEIFGGYPRYKFVKYDYLFNY